MPDVILISQSAPDWHNYLTAMNSLLDRNLTRELDSRSIPVRTLGGFVSTLIEAHTPGISPALSDASVFLRHASASFLWHCDSETLVEVSGQLNILPLEGKLSILSGTLSEWREAIILGCQLTASKELRILLNKCMLILEANGLQSVWFSYRKENLKDNTFKLLEIK